jgi:hypothetical protein
MSHNYNQFFLCLASSTSRAVVSLHRSILCLTYAFHVAIYIFLFAMKPICIQLSPCKSLPISSVFDACWSSFSSSVYYHLCVDLICYWANLYALSEAIICYDTACHEFKQVLLMFAMIWKLLSLKFSVAISVQIMFTTQPKSISQIWQLN